MAATFRARLWNIGGGEQFLMGAYALDGLPTFLLLPLLLAFQWVRWERKRVEPAQEHRAV